MKKSTLLLSFLIFHFSFFIHVKAQPGIITTVAGMPGVAGFYGDGGQATSAEISGPMGVKYNVSGKVLYIADVANNCVRAYNVSTGIITTFAGIGTHGGYSGNGGAATSAEFNSPDGIATDNEGNVYIVDRGNNCIRVINTSGIVTIIAGNRTAGYSGDGGQATSAELKTPSGVAVDAAGNIYIADRGNNVARKINTSGVISTVAGINYAGYSGDGGSGTSAELNTPYKVSVDVLGNLYIADGGNNRIRKVSTTGIITTAVGNGVANFSGDGGSATSAEINKPADVAFDTLANMYIADWDNQRIRKVNSSGIISTVAGNGHTGFSGNGGQATSAEFSAPTGLSVDNWGNIWVCEQSNEDIRFILYTLEVTAYVTANETCNASTDGSASVSVSEGVAPYTYSWSPGGATTSSVSGLSAGIFTVFVTDKEGITGSAAVTITKPAAITITPSFTPVTCNGLSNGSVNASVSGGVSPYTYSWAPGGSTTTTETGLSAGTYTIYIEDNNGCTANASTTVTQPATLSVSISASPDSIGVGQFDTLTATGAVSYLWSTGETTSRIIVSPTSTTSYSVIGTSTIGCIGHSSYLVNIFNPCLSHGQPFIITEFAGTPRVVGYSGDGGAATSAKISGYVGDVALDAAGNVYIADGDNYKVRKVMLSSGIISTIAGSVVGNWGDGGPATSAEMYYPGGITVNQTNGNVYISDVDNFYIREVDASGTFTTLAGNGYYNGGFGGYSGDGGPATSAELNFPLGIAVDASGNIYIADSYNCVIRKVNSSGTLITTFAGNGIPGYSGDGHAATSAELSLPTGVGIDASNNVYIMDNLNNCIRKVNSSGTLITTVAGTPRLGGYSGDGGPATSAELNLTTSFSFAGGVKIDGNGNLFIGDNYNQVIREVSTSGIISTVAGNGIGGFYGDGGPATLAELNSPGGIAINSSGDIYVYDLSNDVVRKLAPTCQTFICATTYSLCPGNSTTLTANTSGGITPYTYSWSTGQTTSSITIYPVNCTPITLTVSDEDGCSSTATYTPNVLSIGISGPSAVCGGTLIGSGDGSYYNLDFSASLPCNNCSSPTYSWTLTTPSGSTSTMTTSTNTADVEVPGTDATTIENGFTVTVQACCGSFCCSQSLVIGGCCINEIDHLIDPDLNVTSSINVSSFYSGGFHYIWDTISSSPQLWVIQDINSNNAITSLEIDGVFNVDQNLTIRNCDIYMGTNALIYVNSSTASATNPGPKLTIENCHIHACNTMWDGIYVSQYSEADIIQGSLIEDAKAAVVSMDGGNYYIDASTLNKNYIGLEVQAYNGTHPGIIQYSQILDNVITSTLPPYNLGANVTYTSTIAALLAPYPSYASYMGMLIDSVNSITVGYPTFGDNNIFENLYYGIYSKASNVNILNNEFENIDYPSSLFIHPYGIAGAGIMAMGDGIASHSWTANIGGTSIYNDQNYFLNCRTGIEARDTINVNAGNNTFSNVTTGIYLLKNYKNTMHIGFNSTDLNYFTNVNTCVYPTNNPYTTLDINYNAIYSCGTGIDANNNPSGHLQVTHNVISSSSFGIEAIESSYDDVGSNISNNTVNSVSVGIYGIHYKGYVSDNAVNIITSTCSLCRFPVYEGIYLIPSASSIITTNTVTCLVSADEGINISSPGSNGNNVICNTINDGVHSMTFYNTQANDYIDGNSMNTPSSCGLYVYGTGSIIGIQGTLAEGLSNCWNPYNNSTFPYSTFSNAVLPGSFYVSSTYTSTPCEFPTLPSNTGAIPVKFFPSSGPDCFVCSGTSPCESGSGSNNNMSVVLAKNLIKDTNHYKRYTTAAYWAEKQNLYAALHGIDSTFLDSSTVIRNFYDSVIYSNMGYLYKMDSLFDDSIGFASSADLTGLAYYNSLISSPDTTESIAQTVNNIYLAILSGGQMVADSAQAVTLRTIAPLCPSQYGYGVYIARALLSQIDTIIYVSNCENTADTNSFFLPAPPPPHKNNLSANVYPNPANTQISIEIIPSSDKQFVSGEVEYFYLYNEIGQLIEKATLTNRITILPLSYLAQGIYHYRIVDSQQNCIKADHLLIMR